MSRRKGEPKKRRGLADMNPYLLRAGQFAKWKMDIRKYGLSPDMEALFIKLDSKREI